jgi:hypothetical protein
MFQRRKQAGLSQVTSGLVNNPARIWETVCDSLELVSQGRRGHTAVDESEAAAAVSRP